MTKPIRIVRAPHDDKYFASSRITPQDRTLSWEARGMLWYLLSKPDTWEVQPTDLQQGCGRDKVYRILNELISHRYIERVEERTDTKKFVGIIYRVYEQPYPEKPDTEKPQVKRPRKAKPLPEKPIEPHTDLPYTANTDIRYNRTTENTESALKSSSAPRPPNPMYDAIKAIWGYTESLNGEMAKMLRGKSTHVSFKPFNLPEPIDADDLMAWASWYRRTELHGDPALNMVQDRMKIQSSISAWREKRAALEQRQKEREQADREWEAAHPELYNNPLRRDVAVQQ